MTPSDFYKKQYELVCDSRNVLFDYCKIISQEHFLKEQTSFGRGGSIRNLLVHIANTYQFWIGKEFLKKQMAFTDYTSVSNIDGVIQLFSTIDILIEDFFLTIIHEEDLPNNNASNAENNALTFKYFTHVITHEFHHKGQILSLSRQLGYTPVDTDVIR